MGCHRKTGEQGGGTRGACGGRQGDGCSRLMIESRLGRCQSCFPYRQLASSGRGLPFAIVISDTEGVTTCSASIITGRRREHPKSHTC